MNEPRCAVKNCERRALLSFGDKWICGECYMKIRNNQVQEQNRLIEEIEIAN